MGVTDHQITYLYPQFRQRFYFRCSEIKALKLALCGLVRPPENIT